MVLKGLNIGIPDSIETPTHLILTGSIVADTGSFGGAVIFGTGSFSGIRATQVVATGSIQSQSVGVPVIAVGSPIAVTNTFIQVGQSGTAAGSEQWTLFHQKFGAVPKVIATVTLGSGWIAVGSVSAGSFLALTAEASATFDWIAAGTK
jgi:hypothetical protein